MRCSRSAINLLLGYGGMVSLGHAAYLGVAGYACILAVTAGYDHLTAAIFAIAVSTAAAALFGLLALRAPGLGFLMITLALGQIVWGIAYRGQRPHRRRQRHPVSRRGRCRSASTSRRAAASIISRWSSSSSRCSASGAFSRSPFGASLQGTRDQPRRMRMLGHNVWLIQWLTFVIAGVLGLGRRAALRLLQPVHLSPHAISLQQSAEVLLMAILGGAGTLTGPIVGAAIITLVKNVVSTYVERWNTLLGADLRGRRSCSCRTASCPACGSCGGAANAAGRQARQAGARRMTPALEVTHLKKALRRPAGHQRRVAHGDAGRAAPDHRAERRRQDHAVQPDHRRPRRRCRLDQAVRAGVAGHADAAARASRPGAHLPDPHAVPERDARHNVVLALLGLDRRRWNRGRS